MALPRPVESTSPVLSGRKDVNVYAEATVSKISKNKKKQTRTLMVSKYFTAIYEKGLMKRVVVHEDVREIHYLHHDERGGALCTAKTPASVDVLFKLETSLNEPDLLLNIQEYSSANKPPRALDILRVIVDIIKTRPPYRNVIPVMQKTPLIANREGKKPLPMDRIVATFNSQSPRQNTDAVPPPSNIQETDLIPSHAPPVHIPAQPNKENEGGRETPAENPYKLPGNDKASRRSKDGGSESGTPTQKSKEPVEPVEKKKTSLVVPAPSRAPPAVPYSPPPVQYSYGYQPSVLSFTTLSSEGSSRISRASSLAAEASRLHSKARSTCSPVRSGRSSVSAPPAHTEDFYSYEGYPQHPASPYSPYDSHPHFPRSRMSPLARS